MSNHGKSVSNTGSRPQLNESASVQFSSMAGSGTGLSERANLEGAESLPGWQSLPAPMQPSSASGSTDDQASTADPRGATIPIAEEHERSFSDQRPDDVHAPLDAHDGGAKTRGVGLPCPGGEEPQEVCAADDDASVRGCTYMRSMRLNDPTADGILATAAAVLGGHRSGFCRKQPSRRQRGTSIQ